MLLRSDYTARTQACSFLYITATSQSQHAVIADR